MTYSIIDTDLDSVESTHNTLASAIRHYHRQSELREYRDGRTTIRTTTYTLHHSIRDDATGEWITRDDA